MRKTVGQQWQVAAFLFQVRTLTITSPEYRF